MWRGRRISLNKFTLWFDSTWSRMEHLAARIGKHFPLTNLLDKAPVLTNTKALELIARHCDSREVIPVAESVKVTDNSLLLFYAPGTGKYLPFCRAWELWAPPLVLVFSKSWIPAIGVAAMFYIFQPIYVSSCRLHVVRMDLLPHAEAILFQKVGLFGRFRYELVPIKNLEKMSPMHSKFEYFHLNFTGMHEKYMFRDVETHEEYAFVKDGVWMEENLEHPLIN